VRIRDQGRDDQDEGSGVDQGSRIRGAGRGDQELIRGELAGS